MAALWITVNCWPNAIQYGCVMGSLRCPIFFWRVPRIPNMSSPAFWQSCLDSFQRSSRPSSSTPGSAVRLEDAERAACGLVAPSRFVLQWVKERYARPDCRDGGWNRRAGRSGWCLPLPMPLTDLTRLSRIPKAPDPAPAATRRGKQARPEPGVHLRLRLRLRQGESACARRRDAGRRAPGPPTTRCSSTAASASARRT